MTEREREGERERGIGRQDREERGEERRGVEWSGVEWRGEERREGEGEREKTAKLRMCSGALDVLLVEVPDHRRAVVEGSRSTKSQTGRLAAGN